MTWTSVNGIPGPWDAPTRALWALALEFFATTPKFVEAKIESANYFTGRPCQDEYDRGSNHIGFTFVVWEHGRAGVHQVSWPIASAVEAISYFPPS
jgi:hypothetical protein